MPLLAVFLRKVFQNHLFWLSDMFDRKIALRLAWVAFAVSLLVALFAAVNLILGGLTLLIPDSIVVGASWVMPDNLEECVTAYFTVKALILAFDWKYKLTHATSSF